ncbi:MAG: polyphosphate kinase 2 family protein [Thermoleophilia bacterium]|nr:polyphosphate kinase 2 family protein [Thermoleophilia bacterium]
MPKTHVDLAPLRVGKGRRPRLDRRDPGDDLGLDRDDEADILADLTERLERQQGLLAASRRSLLAVFQGVDAAGKDGVIKALGHAMQPMLIHLRGFSTPTKPELAHDYLWRVHQETPEKGRMSLFNRSHYEDVLVVRVDELVPRDVWEPRFEQINRFEQFLTDNGTTIVKFMLHVSPDEQLERLRERVHNPIKRWKHNPDDYARRAQWDEYAEAYEDAIRRTSRPDAPWLIVPADRKWVRNIVVMQAIAEALEGMDLAEPPLPEDLPEELRHAPAP